jgi:ribonuclease BN (tRNA processing enzyme)
MDDIIITTLGTVSPYTKGNMNCPGYLIEYHDKKILLDCGNGITRLLEFPNILKNLTVIVTHFHKDHFGDLSSLQYATKVYNRLGLINEKMQVYLPKEDYKSFKQAITGDSDSFADYIDIVDGYSFMIDDMKITFYNNGSHTIPSFMVKLENTNNKIVYTSDIGTTNYNGLVNFCKNSDLLICESSFLLKHNANSTTHMTAYMASMLANDANVDKLLLTHFWPEEDKELYLAEAKENFLNTEVAIEGEKIVLNNKKLSR